MVTLPDSVKEKLWDKTIDFAVERVGVFADERLKERIEALRGDKPSTHDINAAMKSASELFAEEYEDRELVLILTQDTAFYDVPSVQAGVREYLENPFLSEPWGPIEKSFYQVLKSLPQARAKAAAMFYFDLLQKKLFGIKEMQALFALLLAHEQIKQAQDENQKLVQIIALLTPKETLPETALAPYLNFLIECHKYVYPRGIRQTTRSVALKLDEVFVSLVAERETIVTFRPDKEGEIDYEAEYADERLQAIQMQQRRIETTIERVDLSKAVLDHSRLVILGAPGAGKTTLMRFLALHFAHATQTDEAIVRDKEGAEYGQARLPIYVRIADYAEALAEDSTLCLREFLPKPYDTVPVSHDAISALFDQALADGQALILLDGLDEIIDVGDRSKIAKRIEEFLASIPAANRIVVTSRIAGYRSSLLSGEFQHFTLRDFERPQIEKFLNRWCVAVEKFHTPDSSEAENTRKAQAEINGILDAVDKNIGVQRLAANPLLLTILALIHRTGSRLPSRRVALYQLASQTLLEDWQLARGISEANIVQESEALRLLGPLAYWMHEHKPSGIISEREAKEKLAEILADMHKKEPDDLDISKTINDFLRRVREHTGIFVERGSQGYGFMHLTFEEYFAARELVRRRKQSAQNIYRHRHQARWDEPILLAIAYESADHPDDASDLIRTAVLAEGEDAEEFGFTPSLYEDILHRDLLFAVRCIGDCTNVETELATSIVKNVLDIYFERQLGLRFLGLFTQINNTLRLLQGTSYIKHANHILLTKLNSNEWAVHSAYIQALHALDPTSSIMAQAYLERTSKLLTRPNGDVLRRYGVDILGQLCKLYPVLAPQVLDLLISYLEDNDIARSCIYTIGDIAIFNQNDYPNIIQVLLSVLENHSSNWQVQIAAIYSLGKMGEPNSKVIDQLLLALQDLDYSIVQVAAQALGDLKCDTPQIIDALQKAAKVNDASACRAITNALIGLGYVDAIDFDKILITLTNQLQEDQVVARYSAANALGTLLVPETTFTDSIILSLINALNDTEEIVIQSVVIALVNRCQSKENVPANVANALITLLEHTQVNIQNIAAEALCNLGIRNYKAMQIIKEMLNSNYNNTTNAANALAILVKTNREISIEEQHKIVQALYEAIVLRKNQEYMHDGRDIFYAPENALWDALWQICQTMDANPKASA